MLVYGVDVFFEEVSSFQEFSFERPSNLNGQVTVDDVYKMESFSEGIKVIEHRLDEVLNIRSMNVSRKIVSDRLSERFKNRILDVYNSDFDIFNYDTKIWEIIF
jgi:hypothetical protein